MVSREATINKKYRIRTLVFPGVGFEHLYFKKGTNKLVKISVHKPNKPIKIIRFW
jgi:hypothetical protein